MYNVSSGPSKIAAKTRRHHKQQLEVLQDNRGPRKDKTSPSGSPPAGHQNPSSSSSAYPPSTDVDAAAMTAPRPVFNSQQSNNRKSSGFNRQNSEPLTAQHEDMIRFISDEWRKAQQEFEAHDPSRSKRKFLKHQDLPVSQCPHLQEFEPIDLEDWWGKRILQGMDLPNTT